MLSPLFSCAVSSSAARTRSDTAEQAEICGAHDSSVWDLAWHPLGGLRGPIRACGTSDASRSATGHILASGSNDHTTRFWTRNRPGDDMDDKYNANQLPEEKKAEALVQLAEAGACGLPRHTCARATLTHRAPARLNPTRYGRMPAVLEGVTLPKEDGEVGLAGRASARRVDESAHV